MMERGEKELDAWLKLSEGRFGGGEDDDEDGDEEDGENKKKKKKKVGAT